MQCCVCGSECEAGVCRRCGCAVYCSKQCQARDWPSHREHCRPHLLKLISNPASGGTGVTATENIGPGTRSGELSHWSKSLEILCADWCRSYYALKTPQGTKTTRDIFCLSMCLYGIRLLCTERIYYRRWRQQYNDHNYNRFSVPLTVS